MNNFVKQAYIQGLAARAVLRARIMQKQAGGVKDYAMAGGIGAGGGALIGALVNAARKKNILTGALTGAGIGGVAGLGYQGIKDLTASPPRKSFSDILAEAKAKHRGTGQSSSPTPRGQHYEGGILVDDNIAPLTDPDYEEAYYPKKEDKLPDVPPLYGFNQNF